MAGIVSFPKGDSRKRIRALGIDLGTTNSTVAALDWHADAKGPPKVRCVEIDQRTSEGMYTHTIVPSIVAIDSGKLVVGEGAKRLRSRMADRGLELFRSIFWETKNTIGAKRTFSRAPQGFRSARDIAGHILAFLKSGAEADGDGEADRVVITVPASFQFSQREDTLAAAHTAGFKLGPGDLLDEPVAALIDFLHSHGAACLGETGRKVKLLAFDFGGGTCDVALFAVTVPASGGPLEISPASISRYHRLGGGDIDAAIVHEVLIPELLKQNGLGPHDLDFDEKDRELAPALLGLAESLKIGLCSVVDKEMKFGTYNDKAKSCLSKTQPGEHGVTLKRLGALGLRAPTLTVEQLERVMVPFFDTELLYARETEFYSTCSIFAPLQDGLDRAGWDPSEITHCLLAGGASLMPFLPEKLKAYLPSCEILKFDDADLTQTAIARGAALHAFALAANGRGLVVPVAGDDIKIRTAGGDHVLITRGTRLPAPTTNGMAIDRSLSVPKSSATKPLNLRIDLVRSDGKVFATKPFVLPPPYNGGEGLEVHHRLDENQRLTLQVLYDGIGGPQSFAVELDNPFSHVVNPNARRERLAELEERMRTDDVPKRDQPKTFDEIIDLHSELGNRQKATQLLKKKLMMATDDLERSNVLFRLGALAESAKHWENVAKFYAESFRLDPDGSPMFNLSISYYRRREYLEALKAIDQAIEVDSKGAYHAMKGKILAASGDAKGGMICVKEALSSFAAPKSLTDWELGWYLDACIALPDEKQAAEAKAEMKRRAGVKGVNQGDEEGDLPAGPTALARAGR